MQSFNQPEIWVTQGPPGPPTQCTIYSYRPSSMDRRFVGVGFWSHFLVCCVVALFFVMLYRKSYTYRPSSMDRRFGGVGMGCNSMLQHESFHEKPKLQQRWAVAIYWRLEVLTKRDSCSNHFPSALHPSIHHPSIHPSIHPPI